MVKSDDAVVLLELADQGILARDLVQDGDLSIDLLIHGQFHTGQWIRQSATMDQNPGQEGDLITKAALDRRRFIRYDIDG